MGCTPVSALTGITYDCDVPTGGIKRLFLAYLSGDGVTSIGFGENPDLTLADKNGINIINLATVSTVWGSSGTYVIPDTDIAGTGVSPNVFVEIEFNRKDGFSNFTDVSTTNADGSREVVPSIQVEIPKMSYDQAPALLKMVKGNVELVAAVETAAGTYHIVGGDFGLYAGTLDGASGTGRAEKNRWQLTLTGSESEIAVNVEDLDTFNDIVGLALA